MRPRSRTKPDFRVIRMRNFSGRTKCREAYCDLVRQFLTRLGRKRANTIDALSPDGISAFIIEFRRSCSLAHVQKMVTAIRSYLRFLQFRGEIQIDMTGGALAFANWRGEQLP